MSDPDPITDPDARRAGKAVVAGVVQHFSVSALEKADHRPGVGGCLRRYWYRYVGGKAEAERDKAAEAKAKGKALHRRIATYLKTGDRCLDPLEMRGLHMIPPPGPDLLVEASIAGHVTVAGIPMIGFVDLTHGRGINWGGSEIGDTLDPPGTVEVIDWKRKGTAQNPRDGRSYLLTPDALADTIQMSGYGIWASRVVPGVERVRLSHGYFVEKPAQAKKVTRLHVVDDCLRTWEYVEGLGRSIVHAVRETDPDRVDANRAACTAFGGCPHAGYCSVGSFNSLDQSLEALVGKENAMGLMDSLINQGAVPPAQNPQQQAFAALAAREAAAAPQPAPAQAPTQNPLQAFSDACRVVRASGLGWPRLGGDAAQAYGALGGQSFAPGTEFMGEGQLGAGTGPEAVITQVAQMLELAGQLQARAAALAAPPPAPAPVSRQVFPPGVAAPLPPDAPVTQAHLAAVPVPVAAPAPSVQQLGFQIPTAAASPFTGTTIAVPGPTFTSTTVAAPTIGALAIPAGGYALPQVSVPLAPTIADQAAGKKTRAKKPAAAPVAQPGSIAIAQPPACTDPEPIGVEALQIFVNCTPSIPTQDLTALVDQWVAAMAKHYNVADIRGAADRDHALSFGGWRPILAGSARKMVEAGALRGAYRLQGGEFADVVAEALRPLCDLYVRGSS